MRVWSVALVLPLFSVILLHACAPAGQDDAPATLVVGSSTISFGQEKDSASLVLSNSGDEAFNFDITVSSASEGIEWFVVEPDSGVVEGGGAVALLVSVKNREQLSPGAYEGTITVLAGTAGSETVNVSIVVGQPVLQVEPAAQLDFGSQTDSASLVVRNIGDGTLHYNLQLPGPWLVQSEIAAGGVKPNAPHAVTLSLDRTAVPWYGNGSATLTVVSNGTDLEQTPATATIEVWVNVDSSCASDDDCDKPGYYCATTEASGSCILRRSLGESCTSSAACKSGMCVDGVCCNEPCDGICAACSLEGSEGTCTVESNGAPCEDGSACTLEDSCFDGACQPGTEKNCSHLKTECSDGYCDVATGLCEVDAEENKCGINGECVALLETHPDPEKYCLVCRPELSKKEWSPLSDACFIDDKCYASGQSVGETCMICDPETPDAAVEAPDKTPCEADDNPCTADLCEEGECVATPLSGGECDDLNPCTEDDKCDTGVCAGSFYSCDDGLDCTTDLCLGNGNCDNSIDPGWCVIGGTCIAEGTEADGSAGCKACRSAESATSWSPAIEGQACSDGNACTLLDNCQKGECAGGEAKDCKDEYTCTNDTCDPETGECSNLLDAQSCLIAGICVTAGLSPSGGEGKCRTCDPTKDSHDWTPAAEGEACDDGSQCTMGEVCTDGSCAFTGLLCDDGNECTDDECVDGTTCEHTALGAETPCLADQLECTEDVCQEGTCSHPLTAGFCLIEEECIADKTPAPDAQCLACLSELSTSGWSPAGEGEACDDGLLCTINDICQDGACGGEDKPCEKACHDGLCDEDTGECKFYPLTGGECDDGDPCTLADKCQAGECGGEEKDCAAAAAGEECRMGACDPASEPVAGECVAVDLEVGAPCEDGLFCTGNDGCDGGGTCVGGEEPDCSGFTDACNSGFCDEDGGSCAALPEEFGTDCDSDGTGCTVGDYCSGGLCVAGEMADCSHLSDACTVGKCDPTGPGGYECKPGLKPADTPCEDDQFCTVNEKCDDNGNCVGGEPKECQQPLEVCLAANCDEDQDGCVEMAANDGIVCDDADPCTLDDHCSAGACEGGDSACVLRRLNNVTWHEIIYPGHPQQVLAVAPGQDRTVTVWRSLEGLFASYVDGDLSRKWKARDLTFQPPELNINPSVADLCGFRTNHVGVAALPGGKWVVVRDNFVSNWNRFSYSYVGRQRIVATICDSGLTDCTERELATIKSWDKIIDNWGAGSKCKNMEAKYREGEPARVYVVPFADGSFGAFVHFLGLAPGGEPWGELSYYPVTMPGYQAQPGVEVGDYLFLGACSLDDDNVLVMYRGEDEELGQLLNPSGDKSGVPFSLSTIAANQKTRLYCTSVGNGVNLVTFDTCRKGGSCDIYVQAMLSDGSLIGPAMLVNEVTTGNQRMAGPLSVLPGGDFVATWLDYSLGGDLPTLKGRTYGGGLAPLGDEVTLLDAVEDDPLRPMGASFGDGLLAVAPQETDPGMFDLYRAAFDDSLNPIPGAIERRGNDKVTGDQAAVHGTEIGGSRFALAWQSDAIDGDASGISVRVFGDDGLPVGPERQANVHEPGIQQSPSVAGHPDVAHFGVAWGSFGQQQFEDVYARFFDATGFPTSEEFQVNEEVTAMQHMPVSVMTSDGNLHIAWSGYAPDDGTMKVLLRSFDSEAAPLTAETVLTGELPGEHAYPSLAVVPGESPMLATAWRSSEQGGNITLYLALSDMDGESVVPPVVIAAGGSPTSPEVTARAGQVFLTWLDTGKVYGRMYDQQLEPTSGKWTLFGNGTSTRANAWFSGPETIRITTDDDTADISGSGVLLKEIKMSGTTTFVITANRTESGIQSKPAGFGLATGQTVLGWQSAAQDSDGFGIYFVLLQN